jgi:hypothetical protein
MFGIFPHGLKVIWVCFVGLVLGCGEDNLTPEYTFPDLGQGGGKPDVYAQSEPDAVTAPADTLTDLVGQDVCNGKDCEVPCEPNCAGKGCGPDGCGGLCGVCDDGALCEQGICVSVQCLPDCPDAVCGEDGCGGSCGSCVDGESCQEGQCVDGPCEPNCLGLECGDDGCGEECGQCPENYLCDSNACVLSCSPDCVNKKCGADGCGGDCGACLLGQICQPDFTCAEPGCEPDCTGKSCGPNGCGGSCGECGPNASCVEGNCKALVDGCESLDFAGCNGCACEECVCSTLPTCCSFKWTQECSIFCSGLCDGCD